ncbi:MAG TPA: GGDEF and EAL domain-containing protein [Nitrospiria bacterium]|nr:GGDEF and EAL domain-containing protein [Nitrospiria bacterium]
MKKHLIQAVASKSGKASPVDSSPKKVRRPVPTPKLKTARIKTSKKRIETLLYDPKTHLYTPEYFDHRIEMEISRAKRNKRSLGVMLCEFKLVNLDPGKTAQASGKTVLRGVSDCIREATRGTDLAIHWEENIILVVLSDTSPEGVLISSDRIRKKLHELCGKKHISIEVRIGAALYPEHGRNRDELIRVSRQALAIAGKGVDKIHIGEEDFQLNEDSIKVVFQPIMDIRINQLVGYEALSRASQASNSLPELLKRYHLIGHEAFSRDPQDRLSILEMFKRFQAIGQLSQLKQICFGSQMREAKRAELKRVFVNVDFNMLGKIEPAPTPAGMEVILEISELEALRDVESHLRISQKWKAQGYKFAFDDFGAGFISLPFIAQLIPEYIKLDRSTLLQAVSSQKFRNFLKDILLSLKKYVAAGFIAEGVQSEEELQVVKEMEIHFVQGFLLGKPRTL